VKRVIGAGLGASVCIGLLGFGIAEYRAGQRTWYALEMGGRVVGYASETAHAAGAVVDEEMEMVLRLSALRQGVDVRVHERRRVDAATGRLLSSDAEVVAGTTRTGITLELEGGTLRYSRQPDDRTAIIELDPDVIVGERALYARVTDELRQQPRGELSLAVFDPQRGRVQQRRYRRVGTESLALGGTRHDALIVDQQNLSTGATDRLWLEPRGGRLLRAVGADGVTLRLADQWVRWRLGRGDLDELHLYPVRPKIDAFRSLERMKLHVVIQSVGEMVTADSLDVPGQRFTGSVKENRIEGVFEIEHARYGGEAAPPFPPSGAAPPGLEPFLRPGFLIESGDTDLIAHARALTEGAGNTWEAAVRLSGWVASEIRGAIPGGSARQTFDRRAGDCGGHARLLVALARGVGIPARLATGATYFVDGEGKFGQHAWAELHMGDAGWIAVDPTLREVDYIDSGHLRLGSLTSFQPLEMEILEYRVATRRAGVPEQEGP